MPAAYHPDFGQVVNYAFERIPDDPDGQVRATINRIRQYIREDAKSPIIQQQACRIAADPINGVWAQKPNIRFRQDADIAEDLQTDDTRKHGIIESLIRPADQAMLIQTLGQGVEDCDGYTQYAACILTALGIPCTLATVAADPDNPREFSHIYVVAYWKGKRIPLDLSHGPAPGWECPNTRIQEWPVQTFDLLVPLILLAVLAGLALRIRL